MTNALKHVKYAPKGTRGIPQKPDASYVAPVIFGRIDSERHLLNPKVTIVLGVTAASAIFGRPVTILCRHSRYIYLDNGSIGLVTIHPPYFLTLPNEESKTREYIKFANNLRMAISTLAE
ncbi:uracil-DNA glycosylase family protein [Gluconobacter kanchanaburiensis]|uniref:Uracil-DNA glycosylase-like domain-containing protein n=1 Tax=Gluconobacter kanchanaburiensis NBRC 103587 TaxID=1307948 RepID=A0A511BHQ5_9PROT|nr:hypothetical protein GKA01_25340 [Gluconobacter kanchanaburiensis NBRC 103587]